MVKLSFPKLYITDHLSEHCEVAVPFKQGEVKSIEQLRVLQNGVEIPLQAKATTLWHDGSVKWSFLRMLADIKGNCASEAICMTDGKKQDKGAAVASKTDNGIHIETGCMTVDLSDGKLIDSVKVNGREYNSACFDGPVLKDGKGRDFALKINKFKIIENGALCAVVKADGVHTAADGTKICCDVKLTFWKGKPWFELAYRIINTTYENLHIKSLVFYIKNDGATQAVRTCAASSNYATSYDKGENGEYVEKTVDDQMLKYHGNEHMAEVFYGTFFADWCGEDGGVCATVYQAQQNYPKAVSADKSGLKVSLVPDGINKVEMLSGMAREQKMLIHFHDADTSLEELDDRSTVYQMPNRAALSADVYKNAGVFEDIYVADKSKPVELRLTLLADNHARCYGMLNWGDAPDPGYSEQGRGNGRSVWTNNEYDFSHACTLMYARTGERRFLDYMMVSSRHWMDIDVCHFSDDPLVCGGQWEHAARHIEGSHMACSHEWVAGLLDYYHFSGDEDVFEAAMGIANNVINLLESPQFSDYGALHARETGWALRTLIDMYNETNDEKWLDKCEWIIGHFESWEKKYGYWLAPYTDNTVIRVVFMIAIAVSSLMYYYRIRPRENVKGMIVRAVDDLIENCRTDTGLFYYKELPSLQKTSNPNVLEALTAAYELTGDTKYLEAGLDQFRFWFEQYIPQLGIAKRIEGDSVICAGLGTKSFAQQSWPVLTYYKAISDNGMLPWYTK